MINISGTKAVGVRVPVHLLERAKKVYPNFSEFVRCALEEYFGEDEYKTISKKVDKILGDKCGI